MAMLFSCLCCKSKEKISQILTLDDIDDAVDSDGLENFRERVRCEIQIKKVRYGALLNDVMTDSAIQMIYLHDEVDHLICETQEQI